MKFNLYSLHVDVPSYKSPIKSEFCNCYSHNTYILSFINILQTNTSIYQFVKC